MVTEREMPAKQCTNTPFFCDRASSNFLNENFIYISVFRGMNQFPKMFSIFLKIIFTQRNTSSNVNKIVDNTPELRELSKSNKYRSNDLIT